MIHSTVYIPRVEESGFAFSRNDLPLTSLYHLQKEKNKKHIDMKVGSDATRRTRELSKVSIQIVKQNIWNG